MDTNYIIFAIFLNFINLSDFLAEMVKIYNQSLAIYFKDVEERSWTALTNASRGKGFMKTISKSLSLRSQGVPEIPMTGVNCLSELRICRTISLPFPPGIRISVITRSKRPSSNFFIPSFTFNTDFRDRFNRHMNIIISNLVLLKVQFKTDAIKPI